MPISNPVNNFSPQVNVTAIERSNSVNSQRITISSTSVSKILGMNGARNIITIFNKGTYNVFIDVVNTVSADSYMFVLAPGAFYEMLYHVYTGMMFAIAQDEATEIEIREFNH